MANIFDFGSPVNEDFKSRYAISSKEGTAFITLNDQNYPLFYIHSVNGKATKNKVDVNVVGKRAKGKKTVSWSGSGSLKIYEVTSFFKQLMMKYIDNGEDFYFSLQVTNEDKSTPWGRETKILTDCNFDEVVMAQLNGDDEVIEEELPFTFEGVELLTPYSKNIVK